MPPSSKNEHEYLLRLVEIAVKAAMSDSEKKIDAHLTGLRTEVQAINERLEAGDSRFETISTDLAANNKSTERIREMFDVAEKGLRFMGWLGTGLKLALKFGAPAAAVYAWLKGWIHPDTH